MTPEIAERRQGWTTIRRLIIAQLVTLIIALVAFTVAIIGLNGRADAIQTSRMNGRYDSCFLLRGLVYEAAGASRHHEVTHFLASTPLANCGNYAQEDVK